jgi:hypothetical protein
MGEPDTKAARRAARDRVAGYHQEQLGRLLEHVREGFARYDAAELDAFELDDVIHQYTRSARELWKFCELTGSRALYTAGTLDHWTREGEEPDWWELGAPRRRR